MKIDGKALMEQNYETLIDIADVSILDKYNIISKRDAVLQFEKDNEMVCIYIYILIILLIIKKKFIIFYIMLIYKIYSINNILIQNYLIIINYH